MSHCIQPSNSLTAVAKQETLSPRSFLKVKTEEAQIEKAGIFEPSLHFHPHVKVEKIKKELFMGDESGGDILESLTYLATAKEELFEYDMVMDDILNSMDPSFYKEFMHQPLNSYLDIDQNTDVKPMVRKSQAQPGSSYGNVKTDKGAYFGPTGMNDNEPIPKAQHALSSETTETDNGVYSESTRMDDGEPIPKAQHGLSSETTETDNRAYSGPTRMDDGEPIPKAQHRLSSGTTEMDDGCQCELSCGPTEMDEDKPIPKAQHGSSLETTEMDNSAQCGLSCGPTEMDGDEPIPKTQHGSSRTTEMNNGAYSGPTGMDDDKPIPKAQHGLSSGTTEMDNSAQCGLSCGPTEMDGDEPIQKTQHGSSSGTTEMDNGAYSGPTGIDDDGPIPKAQHGLSSRTTEMDNGAQCGLNCGPSEMDDDDEPYWPLSGKPYFHMIFAKSHVTHPYLLGLPSKIVPDLPYATVPAVITYCGKKWVMVYLGDHKVKRFNSSWAKFVIDNKLKIGDGCFFELTENSPTRIKFRAQILRCPDLLDIHGSTSESPIFVD